jgi:uncharacterized membrane protein
MAIRIHEVHPAVVHFPLTLLPLAIGVDVAERLTGQRVWRKAGHAAMPIAAVGASVAAIAGLIAQEEVTAERRAGELLVTHRTLNLAGTGLTMALAIWRASQRRPSVPYIFAGIATFAAMGYSAYLGSKMVYEYGVGVDAAGGIAPRGGTELRPRRMGAAMVRAARQAVSGSAHALQDIAHGELLPGIGTRDRPRSGRKNGLAGKGRSQ